MPLSEEDGPEQGSCVIKNWPFIRFPYFFLKSFLLHVVMLSTTHRVLSVGENCWQCEG